MSWVKAIPYHEVQNGPVVFKQAPKQLAVFNVSGDIYAVDNRCPHEGYPLSEGVVDEQCQLTCNWHNWKFRLRDGACVLGSDDVRAYPTKIEDGYVWIDLSDPPLEVVEQNIFRGLHAAFGDQEFDRICRELSRLHVNGLDPLSAVRQAIAWSYDRLEFGYGHAYAASADWLTLARRYAGQWELQLVCLAEAIEHMAHDALRYPAYPFQETGEPFTPEAFAAAVEAEERQRVEGMVLQGLADGLHWAEMRQAFANAALAHYNSFGHALIYVYKTAQLIEALGPTVEPFLLPPLARHFCYATREDLIPEFGGYADAAAALRHTDWGEVTLPLAPLPFPASTTQALQWVRHAAATHAPDLIYQQLLTGLARNLLSFDMTYDAAFDRPVQDNVSWLDFTHGITFANAVRRQCTANPHLWAAGLLQMACFVGRNRPYLDLDQSLAEWDVTDAAAFFDEVQNGLLDHGLREPIFAAHLVKTSEAVRDEVAVAMPSVARYLLAGLNRFLHTPIKQKHSRRLARQAAALVSRG